MQPKEGPRGFCGNRGAFSQNLLRHFLKVWWFQHDQLWRKQTESHTLPKVAKPCVLGAAALLPKIPHLFPDAALKHDHKCSGLTPHSPSLLWFWRSESKMDLWAAGFQRLCRELAFY